MQAGVTSSEQSEYYFLCPDAIYSQIQITLTNNQHAARRQNSYLTKLSQLLLV